jgi:hypothetical protein
MDVAALIAAIVVVLVLGLGGLLALRVRALIELSREVRRSPPADDAHTAKWRRRRLILMLCALCVFYAVAAALWWDIRHGNI